MKQPQMQGTNDPTIAVGMGLLKSNIAEHKALMFITQIQQLAQQHGLPADNEVIQGKIAQVLMEASGAGEGQPTTEERMLQLQEKELQIAEQRIQSQDIRESAKIAQKDRELDLKQMSLEQTNQVANRRLGIDSAAKILDNSAKIAENEQRRLSERAASYGT